KSKPAVTVLRTILKAGWKSVTALLERHCRILRGALELPPRAGRRNVVPAQRIGYSAPGCCIAANVDRSTSRLAGPALCVRAVSPPVKSKGRLRRRRAAPEVFGFRAVALEI